MRRTFLSEFIPPSDTHSALRWDTPALRRALVRPPSGTCPPPTGACSPSVGYPSRCPSTLLAQWVSRATLVAPSGFSVRPLHLISNFFIRFTTYSHFHPFSRNFIHCLENASTFQKINPLLRNFILCQGISSS
jgi:hypothetical protein